jgi:5-methyltetrahydrofolate--homocysteine methyltransferase
MNPKDSCKLGGGSDVGFMRWRLESLFQCSKGDENMELLQRISEELQKGNYQEMPKLVQEALDQKILPTKILSDSLVAGMDVVGDKFRRDELFIPEVLISAKAMQAGMDVLRPKLVEAGAKLAGKVVLGTVKGDLHDIGKNMVRMLMEGAGFQVIDLGVDISSEKFVEAVKSNHPDIVGLSALLTTTMSKMKEVIESLVEAGVRNSVKVIVGGAPVNEKFAREIGADGYAPDAPGAVEKARRLLD